jgi:hypothetical protein
MRTLFIAHALLLMSDPDAAGGIPAEPNPNTNDAGAAPAPEIATGGSGQDLTELDEDFRARLEAERTEFERIRELTPAQEFEIRPCPGASHLGAIVGTPDGIRCVPLADWRTDRLVLRAGDHVQICVLAGEGLKTWEFYRQQEARAKEQPALGGDVTTRSLTTAEAAGLLGAQAALNQQPAAATSPAVDPLEQTQDVEKVPTGTGQPNTSATSDPATGP